MNDDSWHASEMLLDRFVADPCAVDGITAASLEAHLLTCGRCRARVSERTSTTLVADSWRRVAAAIDEPRLSLLERVMIRLGVSESTARLLAGTPSLGLAGLGSIIVLASAAVASGRATDTSGGFLVLAPLLPLLAIATAFAAVADPAGEAGVATPLHGIGLVLRRAVVLLVAVFMVLGAADLAVGEVGVPVIAWVLPALALTLGALALGTWYRAETAASGLAIVWTLAVVGVRWMDGFQTGYADTATFSPPGQAIALLVLVIATAVVVVRRDQFQLMGDVR